MAADVYVCEMNGASWSLGNQTKLSGSAVSVTARYCTMDSAAPGDSNPIPIPTTGKLQPSYWKNHYLMFSGSNGGTYDFTYVSSIRWYCDGTLFNWDSTEKSGAVFVLLTTESEGYGVASGNYEQATGVVGTSGTRISQHGQFNASSNAENYSSLGSALTIDARKIEPNDTAGFRWSKHLVHQAFIGSGAASGNPGTETYTWVWDEVS